MSAVPDYLLLNAEGEFDSMRGELKSVHLRWRARSQSILVRRKERESQSVAWATQEQKLLTSYAVLDVAARCDEEWLVSGASSQGKAILERWTFQHPSAFDANAKYIPLDRRPEPTVHRQLLYSGADYGYFRAIAIDPEGRFGYALTEEPRALCRLDFGPPSSVAIAINAARIPAIKSMKALFFAQHASTGRKLVLCASGSGADAQSFSDNASCIMLDDPRNSGTFLPAYVVDDAMWQANGFGLGSTWTNWGDFPCR